MAPKSLVLAALLLLVATAGQAPRVAEAAATVPVNMIVSGVVPCATGSNINVAAVPVFPNAKVQLVCSGSVVASVTSDGTGAFIINLGNAVNQPTLLAALLGNQCNVVVVTPLAACNVNLGGVTGTLTAPVQVLTTAAGGLVAIIAGQVFTVVGGILPVVTGLFSIV
ncbi:hypothetical protein EJB05_06680, partial [Eragrostis curvula]